MAFRLYTELHFSLVLHSGITKKRIYFFDSHCTFFYYTKIYRCYYVMPFKKLRSNEDPTYSGIHLKCFSISELHLFIEYNDILDWTPKSKSATSIRNSHRRCSVRKRVLRNFANFTGKRRCFFVFLFTELLRWLLLKDLQVFSV